MSELILPRGVEVGAAPEQFPPPSGKGLVVNETDLPDEVITTYFEENASVIGLSPSSTFQTYVATGNLMTRPKWRPPSNIVEEIVMARELADRDDDIAATIGMLQALCFGEGMHHSHRDEVTIGTYDQIGSKAHILSKFKEMYHEWLIAGQVTTAVVFNQEQISFTPMGADRQRTRSAWIPRIAVLPAEQIRIAGNDIFGTAKLTYRPFSGRQEVWLMEYFSNQTSAARKSQMRQQDPVLTTLLTEQVAYNNYDDQAGGADWVYGDPRDPIVGHYVYTLDDALVHRSTLPKGQAQHPRPMLTRNMPLLEAKRLLTILDYSLLEAGANFLVVARKGSDAKPALPEEIANLRNTIMRATRSGVLIGDHRLDIEIITPKLDELLNSDKRKLIGRKLAAALLRAPDWANSDVAGGQEVLTTTEIISRVAQADRYELAQHMEEHVYGLTAARNNSPTGPAKIWFPKVTLQGMQFWTQMILGLRDRGDIPRKYAVQYAGFDWDAAVQQRKLEVSSGDDKVMTPAAVPFSSPNAGGTAPGDSGSPGPQDRGGGRPPGAKTGAPKATAPGMGKRVVHKNAGETIKAMWDDEEGVDAPITRAGERTYALLESFGDHSIGRLTAHERAALDRISQNEIFHAFEEGPLTIVPVNGEHSMGEFKAVRLTETASMLVGYRTEDDAILARALVFRDPVSQLDAEETAMRWGFDVLDPPPE